MLCLWALPLHFLAQTSPPPVIFDFGGTALSPAHSLPDSTFCKGGALTIHGSHFITALAGESWDSTRLTLGGLPCQILYMNATQGGTSDSIIIQLPDSFQNDTCLSLELVKHCRNLAGPVLYCISDTVCLVGDRAEVAYPDTVFCMGDPNPVPVILGDSGSFCCAGGTNGFFVQADGTVPLHTGAIGMDWVFAFATTHPTCPDSQWFQIDILSTNPVQFTWNALGSVAFCPAGIAAPDTALLHPKGGTFFCADSGLVILDDSLGLVDLTNSNPGMYELWYSVDDACWDSSMVRVEVLARDTAAVIYPIPYQLTFQRICQNEPSIAPVFLNGFAGGDFVALPNALATDSLGVVDPGNSPAGNYSVMYVTGGICPDTVVAALNLVVDTVLGAEFWMSGNEICAGEAFWQVDSTASNGWFEVLFNDSVWWADSSLSIPVNGLLDAGRTYELRHSTGGFCPDTFSRSLTVLAQGDPSFAYQPDFYCLGDDDQGPLVMGNGGGIFSGTTSGTIVDPNSGILDIDGSGPGLHIVQYTTPGPCSDSMLDSVTINNGVNAFFNYPASEFCSNDSNPLPNTLSSGGVFLPDTNLLVLDSLSGEIDLSNSSPGIYQVTYSFLGSCQTSFSQTVSLMAFDDTALLDYAADTFCRDSAPPLPLLLGDSNGVFVGSPGLVFFNPSNGAVDLASTPEGGPYTVRLDLANPCALDPLDSFYVRHPPDLDFHYPKLELCIGDPPLAPHWTGADSAGHFGSFSAPSGLILDGDGVIDPTTSAAGTYWVEFVSGHYCPAWAGEWVSVNPLPQDVLLELSPDTVLCAGEIVEAQLTSSDGISFGFLLNGALLDSSFFAVVLDSVVDGDELKGYVRNAFGCSDTVELGFAVHPRPVLEALADSVVEGGEIAVALSADVRPVDVQWTLWGGEMMDSGNVVVDGNAILDLELEATSLDPSPYLLSLFPASEACPGDTMLLSLVAFDSPFYIPEAISPNGDGLNDHWRISWTERVDPTEYEMRVYNRAGGLVKRFGLGQEQWDGDRQPDGVYWWLLMRRDGGDELQGGLTIKRK